LPSGAGAGGAVAVATDGGGTVSVTSTKVLIKTTSARTPIPRGDVVDDRGYIEEEEEEFGDGELYGLDGRYSSPTRKSINKNRNESRFLVFLDDSRRLAAAGT
jgi:hypothetical protein